MKQDILLSILFDLFNARRITANELSARYGVSPRTIYRYVNRLSPFLPLHIQRGRGGGVLLSDSYRLPTDFLSEREYDALLTALRSAYSQNPDEALLSAKRKISDTEKALPVHPAWIANGDLLVLPDERNEELTNKLDCIRQGLSEKRVLRLLFKEEHPVEPHLIAFHAGDWFLYAFSYTQRAFLLFPLRNVRGVLVTSEIFRPRAVDKSQLNDLFKNILEPSRLYYTE